jgi:hypothetical protein
MGPAILSAAAHEPPRQSAKGAVTAPDEGRVNGETGSGRKVTSFARGQKAPQAPFCNQTEDP